MIAPSLLLAAAAAAPLAPAGPWNVEAPGDLCLLSRPYGTGAGQVVVGFQPVFGSGGMELVVVTPLRGDRQDNDVAKVTRLPDGKVFTGGYYSQPARQSGKRVTRIALDRELYDGLAQTTALRIQARPVDTSVAIVRFAKAAPVFRRCEDDLLTSWGVDPVTVRKGTAPEPAKEASHYFRSSDYPAAARSEYAIGRVRAVLVVGADGKVGECRVIATVGKLFDQVTCDRARLIPFTPGRDKAGAPARSIYVVNVRWSMG